MKRNFLEADGRLNSAEEEHPYPHMGKEGYGPPDPREGFQEPYKDLGRLSPASSGGHSCASTSRFLSNVHKSLHRLKCATAVLQKILFDGQGSELLQTNLAEMKLQKKNNWTGRLMTPNGKEISQKIFKMRLRIF